MRIVVAGFLVVISVALFVSLQCTAKATAQASVAASPYLIEPFVRGDSTGNANNNSFVS